MTVSLTLWCLQTFGERLEGVDYVDTFRNLRLKHEQNSERVGEEGIGLGSADAGPPPAPQTIAAHRQLNAQRRRRDERSLDKGALDHSSHQPVESVHGSCAPHSVVGVLTVIAMKALWHAGRR